jgi:hypothetical protein
LCKLTPRKYLDRVSIIRPALELPSRAHNKYGNYSVPVSRGQLLRIVNNSIRHSEIAFLPTLQQNLVVTLSTAGLFILGANKSEIIYINEQGI